MCIACRERGEKPEFIRVGDGRGAYVHDNPDCITIALKKRSFDRALKGKFSMLDTLGLCRRAGKLIIGFDAVIADITKSAGILITSDLSEKSKKEITFHCEKHNKRLIEIPHTMAEIGK
jgi:ribosomal protein L7Ae-like RNA K-turn-binding protein